MSGPASERFNEGIGFVSVFCYDSAPLATWLEPACTSLAAWRSQRHHPPSPRDRPPAWHAGGHLSAEDARITDWYHELPHLSQVEFDYLLWSCDLNLVRGKTPPCGPCGLGAPIWQIYEQDDGVHADKLKAFMQQWMANWRQN